MLLLFIWVTISVIKMRRKHQVAYGYGPDNIIAGIVSTHGNFAAYIPIALFSLFMCETYLKIPPLFIHLMGIFLLIGRWMHFNGLRNGERKEKPSYSGRVIGMHLTIWPLTIMAIALVLNFIMSLI